MGQENLEEVEEAQEVGSKNGQGVVVDGDGKRQKSGEVQAGLKSSSGEELPLRSIHVRAKVCDRI